MIRLALLLWFSLAMTVTAAPVTVSSGAHDGFTRLVLQFGVSVDWQMGRSADGYELRLAKATATYDLSKVFKVIDHRRLAAIWVDPQTGGLRFGLSCRCHALPFELRPGVVVVDLRDGPAPAGSAFELAFDGTPVPILADRAPPRPKPRPARQPWQALPLPKTTLSLPFPAADSGPMRAVLLRQLARAASQGMVDMTLPPGGSPSSMAPSVAGLRVALGDLPGMVASNGPPDHKGLTAEGDACTPAEALDVAAWGESGPVALQMAEAGGALLAEFDRPDPPRVARAIHFLLFLGFGAEAQQMVRAFAADMPERQVWLALARLVDGDADPASIFATQTACATPAALWAVLAQPASAGSVNSDAVVLAFSALPPHLRQHLGPPLIERFIRRNEMETVRRLQDTILRLPGAGDPALAVLQSTIALASGNAAEAEARVKALLQQPGPATTAALIAFIRARVAQDMAVPADLIPALEAVAAEQIGSPTGQGAAEALVLARAASGDFGAAFQSLPQAASAAPTLWRLLANLGSDDALLAQALSPPDDLATLPSATANRLAARCLGLGFAEAALRWQALSAAPDPLVAAQAHLALSAPAAALSALEGGEGAAANLLRIKALEQLGRLAEAAALLAGDPAARGTALRRNRDWAALAAEGDSVWQMAAATLPDQVVAAEGALARGHRHIENSADTRARLERLLRETELP